MTEATTIPTVAAPASEAPHAGALLRAARLQQGLHIGALSAAIKVPQAKLEALEAGRYDALLDATFTRALANTICRVLKIDAAPVLALLPGAGQSGLANVDNGLNTPYRERSGGADATDWAPWKRPVAWLVGLLLLAAAAFVLVPTSPRPREPLPLDAPPAAILAPADAASAAPAVELAASAALPASAPAPQASAPAAAAAADNALQLRAVQASWVQISDGDGQVLMARLIPAGETVSLSAKPPLRLRIGNALGTELYFRGQRVDLAASAQSNIANLSLP